MNNLIGLSLALFTFICHAQANVSLAQQQTQLQHAQTQLQQQINKEKQAEQQLISILKIAKAIDNTQPSIEFAGKIYSKSNFVLQIEQLQAQLQQKKNWLKLSQQELDLLTNRISVIAWRIESDAANQGEIQ